MTNITHLVQFKGKTIGNFCASTLEPTAFPLQIVWIWDERYLPDRAMHGPDIAGSGAAASAPIRSEPEPL
jgi:hypothetical protein